MLLETMIAIMQGWKKVFSQSRTAYRAIQQAISSICVVGRRTIARSYLVQGGEGDWSSQYKLYSRSRWEAQNLFEPILKEALMMCGGELLPLGADDTRIKKSGKKIKTAHWGRDPLSPPFHVNLQYGWRFLQTSVLVPLHQQYGVSPRALPVWCEEVRPVPKPGKKASQEEKKAYREAVKQHNLSVAAVGMFKQMRQRVDELGGENKTLACGLDGSFCNRTVFKAELERTILIARTRKDASLCFPATEGRRTYGEEKFTPEAVMKDDRYPWQQATIFHGGKWRIVSYKEVNEVLWQRGAGPRRLRLLVVKPVPYRKTKKGRLLYRQPAFLLTTDIKTEATKLLQIYFDRWQVEVAHKELKDNFGLGEAQVRAPEAVARQPVLTVATYSAMHLAALRIFGPERPEIFNPLPKYQRDKTRVSCQELIRHLRYEVVSKLPYDFNITEKSIFAAATI